MCIRDSKGGTWTAQAAVADSAAFNTANIQFTAPTEPTSGVTYALVSANPTYTGSATAATVTATIDPNAGTIALTGNNGAGAANAGTYTWKVKMSAPGYADKTVDVTVTAN